MNYNYIFPSFYAEEILKLDNKKIESFCYEQFERDSGIKLTNVGGWHSQFLKPDNEEMRFLITSVQEKLDKVCEEIDYGVYASIDNWFININRKNDYHKEHDHPGSFLSAVYYVNAGKFKGNLTFHNPNSIIGWFQSADKIKSYNHFNSSTWSIQCETGMLIIFPAWLRHEVACNTTEEDRISIVFNCPIKSK